MAAWLSNWLRDIVLIVLFAAFVDLLVPNNALQKYVKITISLMILLTILAPVIEMLKPDLDIREAAYDAMQTSPGNMLSLSEVLEAGGNLRLEAESRSARLAEAQIADQIRQQVNRVFPVTAQVVDVRLGPGETEGTAEIKAVRLELDYRDGVADGSEQSVGDDKRSVDGGWPVDDGDRSKAMGSADESFSSDSVWGVEPVAPVAPVAVSLRERDGHGNEPVIAAVAKQKSSVEEARLAVDIAMQVGRWWSLETERIEVTWIKQASAQ